MSFHQSISKNSRKFAREVKVKDEEKKSNIKGHTIKHKTIEQTETEEETKQRGKVVKGGNNYQVGSAMGYKYKQ